MTEQQVVNLFNRLYTWNTLATNLNASSVLSDIPSRYGLLKIEAKIGALKFVRVLDRHVGIEGGSIISDIGYMDDKEYHINFQYEGSSQLSSIRLIGAWYTYHTANINIVEVSDQVTWSVYYTDPFYL